MFAATSGARFFTLNKGTQTNLTLISVCHDSDLTADLTAANSRRAAVRRAVDFRGRGAGALQAVGGARLVAGEVLLLLHVVLQLDEAVAGAGLCREGLEPFFYLVGELLLAGDEPLVEALEGLVQELLLVGGGVGGLLLLQPLVLGGREAIRDVAHLQRRGAHEASRGRHEGGRSGEEREDDEEAEEVHPESTAHRTR
eukprot:scaffold840_cov265-Pinguiococcus_pyrenoidosus.AAC.13